MPYQNNDICSSSTETNNAIGISVFGKQVVSEMIRLGMTGCENVGEMGNIALELVKHGYAKCQIANIWGGNLMRVMRKVEQLFGS